MGLYIATPSSTNCNHRWYQWKYHYHRWCTITTGGKPGTNEPIANAATKIILAKEACHAFLAIVLSQLHLQEPIFDDQESKMDRG